MANNTDGEESEPPRGTPSPSRPGSAKSQPGWMVQEMPGVGWVVKELHPAEDTGSEETEGGPDSLRDPSPRPRHSPAPPSEEACAPSRPVQEPSPLPGVMGESGDGEERDHFRPLPSRPQSATTRPQSALRRLADTSAGALAEQPHAELKPPDILNRPASAGAHSSAATEPPLSFAPSMAGTSSVSAAQRAPRTGGNGKPAAHDAFVIFAGDGDQLSRDSAARAAAVTQGLQVRGLNVCQQSLLAGSVNHHLSSSDEAHFMAQAAQMSACAVILLTRKFIERVDSGIFGDSCVAAFTLAKRLPNAIIVAMEPDLVEPTAWGWNQLFARFSGRAVVDLSMEVDDAQWDDSVDRLAFLLNPAVEMPRTNLSSANYSGTLQTSWPASPSGALRPRGASLSSTDADDRSYHCFISHNWGKDTRGRDNHLRVLSIARTLQGKGIKVFLEDWEAHRYASADEAMVDGMRRSGVALMFVTKNYIEKIEEGKIEDDCVAQFNLAKRAPSIIPVVMEPELMKTTKWGWNRAFAHLSGKMVVDLSRSDVQGLPQLLWTASAQRTHAALDLLELRVRQEAHRLHPKAVQEKPPPVIPHKGIVTLAVVAFLFGAILQVLVAAARLALGGGLKSWLQVAGVVSALSWLTGFFMFMFWLMMKARTPPMFDVNVGQIQPASIAANASRSIACLLLAFKHVIFLLQLEADFAWVGPTAAHFFLGGSVVAFVDAAVLSRGSAGNFKASMISGGSLAGWGSAALAAGSVLLSASAQLEHDDDDQLDTAISLEFCGSLLLLLGASLYLIWTMLSPQELRRYFEELVAERDKDKGRSSLRQAGAGNSSEPVSPPAEKTLRIGRAEQD
eukprot:TRINITY_DN26454_c0_g1_i1.p1 TRINITY_DN26454_c0_g1~~TRINITY_DN26454_c0_g1_i1.p1  ORF type:complete len:847 (-),score=178.16 TRINITY_DN26454_c0_g1_i1:207-2747(-)